MKKVAMIVTLAVVWVLSSGIALSSENGNESLFPVQQDQKWGYIDKTGQIIIAPRFDGAEPFAEGLALVKTGEKWGAMDRTGTLVIQPRADLSPRVPPARFSDGL